MPSSGTSAMRRNAPLTIATLRCGEAGCDSTAAASWTGLGRGCTEPRVVRKSGSHSRLKRQHSETHKSDAVGFKRRQSTRVEALQAKVVTLQQGNDQLSHEIASTEASLASVSTTVTALRNELEERNAASLRQHHQAGGDQPQLSDTSDHVVPRGESMAALPLLPQWAASAPELGKPADREYSSSAVFSQPQQHFCADAAPGAASPGSPGRAGLQHSASATWLTATSTHSWASVRQLAHPQQPQPQPPKLMQPQLHQPKTPQSGLQPQVELLPSFSQMLAAAAPLPAANVPCHSVSRAVPSGVPSSLPSTLISSSTADMSGNTSVAPVGGGPTGLRSGCTISTGCWSLRQNAPAFAATPASVPASAAGSGATGAAGAFTDIALPHRPALRLPPAVLLVNVIPSGPPAKTCQGPCRSTPTSSGVGSSGPVTSAFAAMSQVAFDDDW
mmetsp:Transcript_8234/g.24550  ORF Transcript_8234/g.24550 Transcript_8234/m.24550 type:complete len:445 (+) Transcript_8234:1668-3002(+)